MRATLYRTAAPPNAPAWCRRALRRGLPRLLVLAAMLSPPAFAQSPPSETAAVQTVLEQYKQAIERLDATGTERLFSSDSKVFESGGSEGTYAQYLAHHLGPELKEFSAFRFSNYRASVKLENGLALADEAYDYTITTKAGETVQRRGVATSVLKKIAGNWRIVILHTSSRKPPAGK
ncbi:YybH family protein [Sphingomonas metalli]|jgi:ketosteroid isomerase-like protein|nr:nuclear transport factor 2 family protein [Sphingomonas metalli]